MRRAHGYRASTVGLIVFMAVACGGVSTPAMPATTPVGAKPTPPSTVAPPPAAIETYPPPDLSSRPLYWFAPLPPMPTGPGRMFIGSEDFMDLFEDRAPWTDSAGDLQVFKLYGEWVAYHASDDELRRAVQGIRSRGLALAVEAGPLDPPPDCGQGVEGFAGTDEGDLIARRLRAAGGQLDLIALDEPYFFGHVYDGPSACHWSAERIAQGVDAFIQSMRRHFPEVVVGDTEPLTDEAGAAAYQVWLEAFRQTAGYDLAFLHMDIGWGMTRWPEEALALETFGRTFGVPVGIIYTGNFQDADDEAWLSIAGERVKRYELAGGGRPEHVLFQSWHDKPDRALPETEAFTFTGFVRSYFHDRAELGFRTEGAGANLAYRKPTRVSRWADDNGGEFAVDGDPGTIWNSGDFPPQWIEIDLEQPRAIREIRLMISQYPSGRTVHRLLGKGPGTDGAFRLLCAFDGTTDDSQVLTCMEGAPWQGLQVIRVESSSSPSWVGWREIEVVDAGSP